MEMTLMNRLIAGLLLFPGIALASDAINLTEDEFKMVRHYQIALGDARVQRMKEGQRAAAIAKDAGYKVKDLQHALTKAEAAGDIKTKCEKNIAEALAGQALSGPLGKVSVDTEEAHAVAYVEWQNDNPDRLEEEAALAGLRAAQSCPILSSIQVWAEAKANPQQRIFQGLIARGAALRINPDRVRDFAHTRYIKLFEKVKNAAAGDDLSGAK